MLIIEMFGRCEFSIRKLFRMQKKLYVTTNTKFSKTSYSNDKLISIFLMRIIKKNFLDLRNRSKF